MDKIVFNVTEENAMERLDVFLNENIDFLSRSAIQKIINEDGVLINGISKSKSYKLHFGDEIVVNIPDCKELNIEAENIPLDIVYEDNDLLVVYKPKGMVVHPAPGNYSGTLVNALLYHCKDSLSGINGILRPGIVHRIDKDTSGLLLVAKNDKAHISLAEQLKEHSINREYETIVYGNLENDTGRIDAPIGRNTKDRKKMAVRIDGRPSATNYRVLARYKSFTHIVCKLETGRTHQIRVHMAYIGHPVAGDSVYGPSKVIKELNGQCLHAKTIGFIHPASGKYMEFQYPLPKYFTDFIKKLDGDL